MQRCVCSSESVDSTRTPGAKASRLRHGLLLVCVLLAVPLQMGGCTVTPTNPPRAQAQALGTVAGTPLTIELTATNPSGAAGLLFTITSLPQHGTLTDGIGTAIVAAPQELTGSSVRYLAAEGFDGEDSFTFSAFDGRAAGPSATVTITVTPAEPPASTTITEDTTLPTLAVSEGSITEIRNNAVVTVAGDTDIAGTLRAIDGRITLRCEGNVTIDGLIRSLRSDDTVDADDDLPIDQQTTGVTIITTGGAVTFAATASIQTDGPILITDDDTLMSSSPASLFEDVENVIGDVLPTLVPLPDDNPVFDENAPKRIATVTDTPDSTTAPVVRQAADSDPVTLRGVWPPAGAAPPAGDRPIWIFRFAGNRPLNLDNWTVNGPAAPTPAGTDQTNMPGDNAAGRDGKNGLRLNITNNGGPITVTGTVTLNLADGGDGASATAVCASATGGDGGKAGNFRMTASGGVDVRNGVLRINPGRSGSGGAATVNLGAAGAAGCPGGAGDDATATGGNGADNRKRLFVRGNVMGLANIQFGPLAAGNGGNAIADACDGGNGTTCCDGGNGGAGTARGGNGGDASVNLGGFGLSGTAATVTAGNGGDADATGGTGGNGGDCKFFDAGDGGDGGAATATGGAGGDAVSTGGAAATGGNGGDALATGGDAGDGGFSGFGEPGVAGTPGVGTATAGAGGTGDTAGAAGEEDPLDGLAGLDGGDLPVVIFCLSFNGLVDGSGNLTPGVYNIPALSEDETSQVGVLGVEFRDTAGAEFATSSDPAPHFGMNNAQVDVRASSLQLQQGEPGLIGGVRIAPLFGEGIGQSNPLLVQALDAQGQIIDQREVTSLPNNSADPQNPEVVDVSFEVDVSVATFRIIAPPGSFVTILRIYLLDP